jgi:hypothetical protein
MMRFRRLLGKLSWQAAALAFVIFAAASGAWAQGSRNDGIVFSAQGTPAAGAIVAVCTQPANTSTTPCSPLAVLYTDATLTVTAPNPLASDGLGNYHFYAAPGRYTLQFYGGPIRTPYVQNDVMLPNDPATPTFTSVTTSGAITGLTLNLGGNLSVGGSANVVGAFTTGSFNPSNMAVSGSLTYQGGKVPQAEPLGGQAGDAICYVSPNTGNDANDGLSAGTAKADITACWLAVPQFDQKLNTPAGGTIYITSGATVGSPLGAGVGLQIAGNGDPNTIMPNTITTMVRSGCPSTCSVTATLSVSVPSYYVNGALISVSDAQNTFGGGAGTGDATFNGNFTLTNVDSVNKKLTWNQSGSLSNSTVNQGGVILPQGWLFTGDYSVVCVAGNRHTANGHIPKCIANWGNANNPSVRISGSSNPLYFQGFQFNGGQIAAQIGVDTNGSRNGTGGAQGVTFQSDDFSGSNCTSCGPGVDIGSNSFWLRFIDYTIAGDANATGGPLSDPYQAVVINPGSGSGSGLIYFIRGNTNGGAIKLYTQSSGGGLYVDGLSVENNTEAGVWVAAPQSSSTLARIRNVEISDCNTGVAHCYGVRVDYNANGTANTDAVVVESVAAPISGPMICLTACNVAGYSSQVISNLRQGQAGLIPGTNQVAGTAPAHLEGAQVDAARRGFSPVAARFTPLTNTGSTSTSIPANWTTFAGTGTITSVAAPDGTTNAGRITYTSGGTFNAQICCGAAITPAVGDWYIAGVWARAQTANSFTPIQFQWITDTNIHWASTGSTQVFVNQYIEGDGEWRWYYTAQQIGATDGGSGNLLFLVSANSTHTLDYYAPVVIKIPNGTVSANEALEYAINMASYSGTAAAGDVSMLPTQRFRMSVPGSNFQYLWTGTPTADRTITLPDASFTVAQTSQLPLSATSASIGGSSVGAGACASGTVSVTGATTSMAATATPAADPGTSFIPWAFVSSANTVTVRVCNFTASSATPTATTYNVRVIQ